MRFSISAYDITSGAGVLVQIAQKSETGREGGAPHVLLLAPPLVAVRRGGSAPIGFAEMFEGAGQVTVSSNLDGIHLEASEQEKLGVAVAKKGEGTR